ncbi:chromosome partitioning protein ParA [Vibrio sp. 10N.247.311.26]|uniref:chromosome partitioning protein ParA n=2 Tax=unclassified Vibrio TaxID=2614977 RepID=UPI003551865C
MSAKNMDRFNMVKSKPNIKKQNSNSDTAQEKEQLQTLHTELEAKENRLISYEKDLESFDIELKKKEQLLADETVRLREKEQEISSRQVQVEAGLPRLVDKELSAAKNLVEKQRESFSEQLKKFEKEKLELAVKESELKRLEVKCQSDFAAERKELQNILLELRQKTINQVDKESEDRKEELFRELEKEQQVSKQKLLKELERTRLDAEKHLAERTNVIDVKVNNNNAREADLQSREEQLDFQQKLFKEKNEKLNEDYAQFELKIEKAVQERQAGFASEEQRMKEECDRLRASLDGSNRELSLYLELKQKLNGESPEKVLFELAAYKEEIITLKEELTRRPEQQVQQLFEQAKLEKGQLESSNEALIYERDALKRQIKDLEDSSFEAEMWQRKYESLEVRRDALDRVNSELHQELDRLAPTAVNEVSREVRLEQINTPVVSLNEEQKQQLIVFDKSKLRNEMDWLDVIYKRCDDYGIKFNRRILFAFHTALKVAEWSPITVLAGVSGTGKSELPRLYSHFGGISFLSLPVQPNWDSQESMLGYFNSIDDRFDAEPALRFLLQSQKECSNEYPGLKYGVNLLLLDEMNLAHVELYFAEFLSKLEQRRGKKRGDTPCLDIKLGAKDGIYQLPLERNVLWAGTMNQDETTKSLSDKVIDRGIAIHFPRPKELYSRQTLDVLPEPEPLLQYREWRNWVSISSQEIPEKQLKKYKLMVEKINSCLSSVGLALGHRVWQSIEFYMANYPMVKSLIDAKIEDTSKLNKWLKIAFEDQLVQKVMPKLRGVETRGYGKINCLDPIKQLLLDNDFSIVEDFECACQFGHGQFMWNSADYLNNDEAFSELEELPTEELEGSADE